MKVLIVHPALTFYGGAETVIVKLCNFLVRNNVQVGIVTLAVSPQIQKLCEGAEWILPDNKIDNKERGRNLLSSLLVLKDIFVICKLVRKYSKDYDVVNVHNAPVHWAAILSEKPVIWMCNEPPGLWNNPNPSLLVKILLNLGLLIDKFVVKKFIDTICVADEFNAGRVLNIYNKKSEIINYGIEYELFSKFNECNVNHFKDIYCLKDNFVLLQVGMLSPSKNQIESIKTVEILRNTIPNIKLILAGITYSAAYEIFLRGYVEEKKMKDIVIFTGHLSKEEIRDLYYISDVVIQPIKSQGGWLSPFEALCAARPIIVSKEISSVDIIEKEGLGIATDNFVKAVETVNKNMGLYNEIAKKGRAWVEKNLSWELFGAKMLNIFKKSERAA